MAAKRLAAPVQGIRRPPVRERYKCRAFAKLLKDDGGLVSSMEMTIGIMFSFILIIFALLVIIYAIMGTMINNAALESARAGSQYQFPGEAFMATTVSEQVFARSIPASSEVSCSPLSVTTPTSATPQFVVLSQCTVNMGTFLGVPIRTSWTATSNVPVGPESVAG